MRLSELQTKEIINMNTGKRFGGREEYELDWKQISKIGDDIILVKDKYNKE